MSEHIYEKENLIQKFDSILDKTFEEIDNIGMFEYIRTEGFKLQKGIAGAIVEQCVLGYEPDTKQEADLVVIDNDVRIDTELKVTGMRISDKGGKHFVAKEPMSITAVGVYDLAEQTFDNSHFWNKLEHMLIVYYHYLSDSVVTPYEYKDFPVKGYEFHEFDADDIETLCKDWHYVHDLVESIVNNHPGLKNAEWKKAVKKEYIDRHGTLRRFLSYIDLAPKFPPRFRLKKPTVNTIIAKHFGYELEQLPGRYTTVSDVDKKCKELENQYGNMTIGEIADAFGVSRLSASGTENKGIAEQIIVKMFGGKSNKINKIELFERFGLIAKSIAVTSSGCRTEDMKLFHIDFEEMLQETYIDEEGRTRPFTFEDSELYSYFADHEFLCIIYKEPEKKYSSNEKTGKREKIKYPLTMNTFVGFQRLVFSDEFIDTTVRKVWEDTRSKIKSNSLVDVVKKTKDGKPVFIGSGEISSAPNFIKSSQNDVFIRGGGINSSLVHKTECVNGIRMLPQFIWIKGKAVCEQLFLNSSKTNEENEIK